MTLAEPPTFDLEVFFDGDCPLCKREVNMLQRWDKKNRIQFTNIAAADFSAAQYGKTDAEFMAEIQARLPDGTWLSGVEVFRRMYTSVGYGWLIWPTRIPGISHLMDWVYRVFARHRLRLTGRCDKACKIPHHSK